MFFVKDIYFISRNGVISFCHLKIFFNFPALPSLPFFLFPSPSLSVLKAAVVKYLEDIEWF